MFAVWRGGSRLFGNRMIRPCTCDRVPPPGQPYTAEFCRLCFLFRNDPAYRAMWEGSPQPQPVAEEVPPQPDYLDKPCECEVGADCPHYGVQLTAAYHRGIHLAGERGRIYRAMFIELKNKREGKPGRPFTAPPKVKRGCGCGQAAEQRMADLRKAAGK